MLFLTPIFDGRLLEEPALTSIDDYEGAIDGFNFISEPVFFGFIIVDWDGFSVFIFLRGFVVDAVVGFACTPANFLTVSLIVYYLV